MLNKFKIIRWTIYAFIANLWIEWRNRRLETKRRPWVAHRIRGGGVVPLGMLTKSKAIAKASQFGSVRYVDVEVAVIMYGDKN